MTVLCSFLFFYYLKHFSPVVGGFFLSYLQPQKYRQLLLKFKGICSLMVWIIWTSRTLLLFCHRFSFVIILEYQQLKILLIFLPRPHSKSENALDFNCSALPPLINILKYFLTKSKSCWYLHLCPRIFLRPEKEVMDRKFCSLKPLQKVSIYCMLNCNKIH